MKATMEKHDVQVGTRGEGVARSGVGFLEVNETSRSVFERVPTPAHLADRALSDHLRQSAVTRRPG